MLTLYSRWQRRSRQPTSGMQRAECRFMIMPLAFSQVLDTHRVKAPGQIRRALVAGICADASNAGMQVACSWFMSSAILRAITMTGARKSSAGRSLACDTNARWAEATVADML